MRLWPFQRSQEYEARVSLYVGSCPCPEPRSTSVPFPLFSRAQEIITCEGGHPIATFLRDVKFGEMFDNTAIGEWTQPPPALGDLPDSPSMKCRVCGARFWSDNHFHFKDGWR